MSSVVSGLMCSQSRLAAARAVSRLVMHRMPRLDGLAVQLDVVAHRVVVQGAGVDDEADASALEQAAEVRRAADGADVEGVAAQGA